MTPLEPTNAAKNSGNIPAWELRTPITGISIERAAFDARNVRGNGHKTGRGNDSNLIVISITKGRAPTRHH